MMKIKLKNNWLPYRMGKHSYKRAKWLHYMLKSNLDGRGGKHPSTVNIFWFCKHLKGNVWQRLKMMATKPIYNRMFLKWFMYTVY